MAKIKWKGGALLAPVPPAMVTCSDGEKDNIITIAWTGIVNTNPPKTYISKDIPCKYWNWNHWNNG